MVEQLNQTILEMTRSMLFDIELLRSFWIFAVNYSQEILNRLPTRTLFEDITLYKAFYQRKPSVVYLRVFGCPVYMYIPNNKQEKLDAKAIVGFFVGICCRIEKHILQQTIKILKIYVSCNIIFFENPERSNRVRVQVEQDIKLANEMSISEEVFISNRESKFKSKMEDMVIAKDKSPGEESKSEDVKKKVVDNIPKSLCCLKHTRHPPIQNNNIYFTMTSYTYHKLSREFSKGLVLTMTDPTTYEETMSRPNTIQQKKIYAKEIE